MVLDEFSTNQPESRPEIPKSTISPVLDEFSRKHSESYPENLQIRVNEINEWS